MAKINRIDVMLGKPALKPDGHVVIHNGKAYVKVDYDAAQNGINEQAQMLFSQYDKLMEQTGLKKENIIYIYAYLRDIKDQPAYDNALKSWVGVETPPAGIAVEAPPVCENNLLDISLVVAVE